jgi:TonB-linked SusC/RagA family outer membrane protein
MIRQLLILNKVRIILILIVLLFVCEYSFGQTLIAQGVVRDNTGVLPGVTVQIKGAPGSAASTTADGAYKIKVTPQAILVFSSVGYATREISLKDFKLTGSVFNVDVSLLTSTSVLSDVIVVGFATQRKIDLTSAVGTISGKELENRPTLNAAQALEGLVPGLNITQNNGALTTTPSINIRGAGSISSASSASPLVLIDGMDGSLTAINPQDIESISVLKDASATAIYGSRGAFGVILVTTKRGRAGKTQINYNNNFRFTSPVSLPKEMDSYTFAQYFNDAAANAGRGPIFDDAALQRIKDFQSGKITTTDIPNPSNPTQWGDGYSYGNDNVDWFKAMYQSHAFSQEHNISLNGGNDKTTYYLSGNYLGQKGLLAINQDLFNRYGITAKVNTKISDILSVNYSARSIREEAQTPSALNDGFYENLGRQGWPTLPMYDPNGFLFSAPSPALGLAQGGLYKHQQDSQYQQVQLVLQPVKGWVTTAELNYRTMNYFDHYDYQQTYNHDVAGNPIIYGTSSSVSEKGYKENYFESNLYSSYERTIKKHYFKVLVGSQTEQLAYRDVYASRNGIIVPSLPTINTTSGNDYNGSVIAPSVSGQYQNWSTAAVFGRLNYNYADKYLLEANLRYDGSSRFRPDKRWAYFPSVSAGWNINKEDFLKNVKFIDVLKPRVSWGSAGNENTNNWYPTYVTIPVGTANGAWLVNGAPPNTANSPGLVSSTLTWETVRTLNVGMDFGFLNNRLSGSFEWYNRKTLNMVGPAVELPVTLGTAVPPTNNTDLKTQGWELQVSWADHLTNGLGYSLRVNLWDNQTTVTRYPNPTGTLSTYIAGQKVGNIWGFTTVGIAKSQAEMDSHLASSSNGQSYFGTQWAAGDIMYADYNHDGKIDAGANTISNPGDQHVIGNTTPRYNFGVTMHLDYKGFDLNAFFQGTLKQDFWNGSYYFWGVTSDQWHSGGLVQNLDYFRASGDPLGENLNAYYPRPVFGTGKNQYVQTAYLQNAAYVRLKNIQIGYTLPNSLTKRFGIQRIRVYTSGDNLWTASKIAKMFDPETIAGGSTAENSIGQGNVYPLSKVVSFGLSVTF